MVLVTSKDSGVGIILSTCVYLENVVFFYMYLKFVLLIAVCEPVCPYSLSKSEILRAKL